MEDVLSNVPDTVLSKPVELVVDVLPQHYIHRLLQRMKILPTKKTLVIRPIVMGNLIRISKQLLTISHNLFSTDNPLESNYTAISQHAEKVAIVVAIAIHNKKREPPASLVRFIMYNFTPTELENTLKIVLAQMNLTGFMTSIVSVKGLNVLESANANARNARVSETSPMDQGSQIAPGI